MLHLNLRRTAAAILASAAAVTIASVASASPPSNITVENLSAGDLDQVVQENNERIKFQTKDATDLKMQKFTFGANSATGWHHHPGATLVIVQSGSVELWHSDCGKKTYGPGSGNGSSWVEGEMVHQATSESGATVYVTYIVPDGSPVRVEEPVPFCAQH
jgi:quercetin dioxygenase-like cupin family protein